MHSSFDKCTAWSFHSMLICRFLFSVCNITWSKVTILQLGECPVRSFLHDMPLEKLNQQPNSSANSLIESSKKKKDLRAITADAVLAALRSKGTTVKRSEVSGSKESKNVLLWLINFVVLIVLTRPIMLWNKGLKKSSDGRTDKRICSTSCLRTKKNKALFYTVSH